LIDSLIDSFIYCSEGKLFIIRFNSKLIKAFSKTKLILIKSKSLNSYSPWPILWTIQTTPYLTLSLRSLTVFLSKRVSWLDWALLIATVLCQRATAEIRGGQA